MFIIALLLLASVQAAFIPGAFGSPFGYGGRPAFYGRGGYYGGYAPRYVEPAPVVRQAAPVIAEPQVVVAPPTPVVAPAPAPVRAPPAPRETDNYGNALVEHPFAYLNDDRGTWGFETDLENEFDQKPQVVEYPTPQWASQPFVPGL